MLVVPYYLALKAEALACLSFFGVPFAAAAAPLLSQRTRLLSTATTLGPIMKNVTLMLRCFKMSSSRLVLPTLGLENRSQIWKIRGSYGFERR